MFDGKHDAATANYSNRLLHSEGTRSVTTRVFLLLWC